MNRYSKLKKLLAIALISAFAVTTVACEITGKKAISENSTNATASENSAEYSSIFEKDKVIDIKIVVDEEDLQSMLNDPMAEEYKAADITVNGTKVENVGFRTKGNSTLKSVSNSDSDRFSFRIKLDKYVDDQTLLGLDELVVNNMYSDPSYMREYLSYEALREIGADVPETVFANIYINGQLYGFYLCVEAIDDSFLERNFGDNNGNLYKQEQGSTLQYVEGSNYDKSELKIGNDETKIDLKNFITILNEMPQGEKGDIESVLDVDSALKYIAANTILGSYDSYNGNLSHNYYLYGEDGKFTVLPWDYNMSLAGFGGNGSASTIPIDEPVSGVNIKNLPLINNLLLVDEYKEKYHEYVEQLLNYLENFEKRVTEVAKIIRPYVEADPSKFYTMEQFEANIKYTETNINTGNDFSQLTSDNNRENKTNNPESSGEMKTDGTTAASQNANGYKDMGEPDQIPQGTHPGFQEGDNQLPPYGFQQGEKITPPKGFENGNMQPPPGDMGANMKGGRNGGGKGMTGGSIINYVRDRIANIKKQLSGELPTTGNTTMINNSMPSAK